MIKRGDPETHAEDTVVSDRILNFRRVGFLTNKYGEDKSEIEDEPPAPGAG